MSFYSQKIILDHKKAKQGNIVYIFMPTIIKKRTKKQKINNTLQVQGNRQVKKKNKRIYLSILQNNRGIMTVEMVVAFPLFLFAFLGILFLFQILMLDEELHKGMIECARQVAKEEYPQKTAVLAKKYWENYVDTEYIDKSWVKNGIRGISFLGSYYNKKTGEVILKVQYQMQLKVPNFYSMVYKGKYEIHQRVFRGYQLELEGEGEEWVYITENQSVYHISRQCSYLQLKIHHTNQVQQYLSGQTSYDPCEFCMKNKKNLSILYITDQGKKYHSTLNCSGLKRTVSRIKKSKVAGLSQCSRCGKK